MRSATRMVDMEVDIPFDLDRPRAAGGPDPNGAQILPSIGKTLYFCIPRNDQLLGYWDTVADRLFKIHNSLNLQGVFQQLPLFDPPIDPALLVRAAAAGLDVSAIVSGLNQPLPLVRFQLLVSKAAEICQEVKALGASLLAAIEKQDNESISLLRAQHENTILGLAKMVKYAQWQEAQKATQALQLWPTRSSATPTIRRLLGRTDAQITSSIPQLIALDPGSLQNLSFSQTDPRASPRWRPTRSIPISRRIPTTVSDGEMVTLSKNEVDGARQCSAARTTSISSAEGHRGIGGGPGLHSGFLESMSSPWASALTTTLGAAPMHAQFPQASAAIDHADADTSTYEANQAAKLGSYSRREAEWTFQSNTRRRDQPDVQADSRRADPRSHRQEGIRQSSSADGERPADRRFPPGDRYRWRHSRSRKPPSASMR